MAKNILVQFGEGLGKAVGGFERTRSQAFSNSSFDDELFELKQRPKHLTALARGEQWRGGNDGAKLYAQQQATQNTWVYAAIDKRISAVSGAKFDIVYNPGGVAGEGQVIPSHPISRLLRKPNPYMGGVYLRRYSQYWADLDGNFFWLILPDPYGKPAEIWALPSCDVTVEPNDRKGDGSEIIHRYIYEPSSWGGRFEIDPHYIVHFRYPNPFNYFRGMSPLVAASLPSQSDTAMSRWNHQFFGSNNTMPSAVINLSSGNPKKPLEPSDVASIKEKLSTEYSAFQRKTVVTNAYDMGVELLGWSAKDMDFLSGRQFTKEEIFLAYGVPPGMMDKNATEANALAALASFNQFTIDPLLQLYNEELNTQLVQRFYSKDIEFRFKDVKIEDKKQKLAEAGRHEKHITIDEYRDKYLDMPVLPDGRGKMLLSESTPKEAVPELPFMQNPPQSALPNRTQQPNPLGVSNATPLSQSALRYTSNANIKSAVEFTRQEFVKGHLPYLMLKDLPNHKGQRSEIEIAEHRKFVAENGITKPIVVQFADGELTVVDGAHRVGFAGEFNIEQIPAEGVDENYAPVELRYIYTEWLRQSGINKIVDVKQVDTENSNHKALRDLGKYRRRIMNKGIKGVGVVFVSEVLSEELLSAIKVDLQQAGDKKSISSIFDYYQNWLKEGSDE